MFPRSTWAFLLFAGLATNPAAAIDRPDIPVADFEGDDYGAWTTTGTAFGRGPARGALPGQMAVEGFAGRGLVNSFLGGDDATGTLISPPFPIDRPWINFLVGGGKYSGETCVNLRVDGQVVRTATGPNDRPGGSERLAWHSWDVAEFVGRSATIEVVDRRGGGWGHINVDQIVQGDQRRQELPATRTFAVEKRYLNLPVKNGAAKRRMSLSVAGEVAREFEIELAEGAPDFWAFLDLSPFSGQAVTIAADALPPGSKILDTLRQADRIEGDPLYREPLRPQFHFTSRRGWLNDPNGLVYHKGEYHLFYQHNPYGWGWGNMHWGHAVSPDLIHWDELPIALYPRRFGDWAFSGSAIEDTANTAGFQDGDERALVAAYTSTGRGECIVYSRDRGRTWQEYAGNPVVKHEGRDPKLLWHAASKQWSMAVYDESEGKRWIAFHTSPDLKTWTYRSRIEGFFECPDLFELPVDGDPARKRWILYAADGRYVLGDFDGSTFRPEPGKHQLWHGNFYAAQSYNDAPDGRRIQVGWAQGIESRGMPFNQQMTIPCELTLRNTTEGVRMHAQPVAELAKLRGRSAAGADIRLDSGIYTVLGLSGESLDVRAEFELGKASNLRLEVRGVSVSYNVAMRELSCGRTRARLEPIDGKIRIRVLLDRGSIEVFGNDGRVALSVGLMPADKGERLAFLSSGGAARITFFEAFELQSAWTADHSR